MTFQQFLEKWNGKYLEVAGSANAKNQCVDLANGYIRDVLGLPIIEWTNAVDFPSKANPATYDYIVNTPNGVPQEGDIVVWKPTPGHIAVFIQGDANKFTSFDQNFPVGSPCHVQNHNYTNVIGWLRYKAPIQLPDEKLAACEAQVAREIKVKNETYAELQEVKNDLDGVKKQQEFLDNVIKQYANILGVAPDTAVIAGELQKFTNIQDELRQKDKKIDELEISTRECNRLFDEKEEMYQEAVKEKETVLKALGEKNEKLKAFEVLYKKLEASYDEMKKQEKFIYKHLIFNLYLAYSTK